MASVRAGRQGAPALPSEPSATLRVLSPMPPHDDKRQQRQLKRDVKQAGNRRRRRFLDRARPDKRWLVRLRRASPRVLSNGMMKKIDPMPANAPRLADLRKRRMS